jgi:hypothetical protein
MKHPTSVRLVCVMMYIIVVSTAKRIEPSPEEVQKNTRAGIAQRNEAFKYEKGRGGYEQNDHEVMITIIEREHISGCCCSSVVVFLSVLSIYQLVFNLAFNIGFSSLPIGG